MLYLPCKLSTQPLQNFLTLVPVTRLRQHTASVAPTASRPASRPVSPTASVAPAAAELPPPNLRSEKRLLLFLGLAAVVLPLKGSSTARVAAAVRIYRSSRGLCRTEMLPAQATVAVLTRLPPANPVEDDPDEPQGDPDNDPATIRGLHGPLPLATDLRYII
ncbi:uncharacterized protein ATNIH1004_005422 [Aspergillus tanneri]|uniref:Uncharacterized protein n=1 Tax=Aspergillus tanneri TaxID=1220188 RepID=A0A5M9MWC0_9EURO|nr:uncharacterized protein ATNIH1004_005422 [Aspergillus tanneri]KAA8646747.1 hypothetical protein ATNIH1004_005422 [Aspergillus tanneri]